jgi:hypothetical protein
VQTSVPLLLIAKFKQDPMTTAQRKTCAHTPAVMTTLEAFAPELFTY